MPAGKLSSRYWTAYIPGSPTGFPLKNCLHPSFPFGQKNLENSRFRDTETHLSHFGRPDLIQREPLLL